MHVYTSLKWNFQLLVCEIHPLNLNSILGQFQGLKIALSAPGNLLMHPTNAMSMQCGLLELYYAIMNHLWSNLQLTMQM
jgi:hypothetical protein